MKKSIFILICLFTFSTLSFAKSEVYFMPKQASEASDKIISLIKSSTESIDISIYNFSHKKFAKELVKASKKGLKINVYFDKSKIEKDDKTYKYLIKNGINCLILNKKNHLKLALFDKNKAIFGSANWTKESFEDNYEILYFTDKKNDTSKIVKIFDSLNSY